MMKKILFTMLMVFAAASAFSQVKNFQMEAASGADEFLVTDGTGIRQFTSVGDVKTLLGIPSGGVYTDDQVVDAFTLVGGILSISLEDDGVAPLTVDFSGWDMDASDDFSGSWNDLTGIPADIADGDDDTQLSQEEVQDFVGPMVSSNTETLISVTYDDAGNALNFVVEDDLSQYDNSTSGFLTSEVDGSVTNEVQTLSSSGATNPSIDLSQAGGTGGGSVSITGGTNIDVSQSAGVITIDAVTTGESTTVTDGNTIDFTLTGTDITGEVILDASGSNVATSSASGLLVTDDLSQYDNSTSGFLTSEVDGSVTNELQDVSASSSTDIDDGSISLSSSAATVSFETEQFSTGPFTLANSPTFIISVHRNGVYQEFTDDYTVSGSTLSLTGTTFGAGEELTVVYVHN
jgi:hypothetical protein